jgi:hypothetical protein
VEWEVEYTDEFETWWSHLSEDEQERVATVNRNLIDRGPLPMTTSPRIMKGRPFEGKFSSVVAATELTSRRSTL